MSGFLRAALSAFLLGLAIPAQLLADDARTATAVADPARSAANRALDDGRMPAAVLAFADLQPGSTVVDWGAGGGYYSEMLSRVVGPRGRVYALANAAFFKAEDWAPIMAAHPNILVLAAAPNALQLPPASTDAIFAHLEFHDLYLGTMRDGTALPAPQTVLANWHAALRPGGTVIIADHVGAAGDPTEIARTLHRIDPAVVKSAMEAAGFELIGESSVLHRSEDDHTRRVFDAEIRGKTDRFLLKFRKK